ncbi:DMT family transporter [Nocardioides sp. AN3]
MRKWLLLAGAILTEVAATLLLKCALDAPVFYVVVIVGYVAAFVFLSLALRAGMGLGAAYGIWGAIGVALTAALSSVFYSEAFTRPVGVGITLVIAGVLLVQLGSRHAHRCICAPAGESSAGADR